MEDLSKLYRDELSRSFGEHGVSNIGLGSAVQKLNLQACQRDGQVPIDEYLGRGAGVKR